MKDIVIATFYHFSRFEDLAMLRDCLLKNLSMHGIKGTVLLAPEGVNGTLAGSRNGIDNALRVLRTLPNCAYMEYKESNARIMPFFRLKVRVKREIIAMKVPGVDPQSIAGSYVEPRDWNNLISDPKTILIDTRNDFEAKIGTFYNATNPGTLRFSDLPGWLEKNRSKLVKRNIAMFCTGGIRCEKATSYLKQRGINDVFQLKGGILSYLDQVPETESLWQGECFVFDYRVSLKHNLEPGEYKLCHACRRPISSIEQQSPNFVHGVSCDYCINQRTDKQRERYAARQTQVELAENNGECHLGRTYADVKISLGKDE